MTSWWLAKAYMIAHTYIFIQINTSKYKPLARNSSCTVKKWWLHTTSNVTSWGESGCYAINKRSLYAIKLYLQEYDIYLECHGEIEVVSSNLPKMLRVLHLEQGDFAHFFFRKCTNVVFTVSLVNFAAQVPLKMAQESYSWWTSGIQTWQQLKDRRWTTSLPLDAEGRKKWRKGGTPKGKDFHWIRSMCRRNIRWRGRG